MNRKEQKIHEIVHHPDFSGSRVLSSLLKCIDVGIGLNDEKRLFIIVQEAYKYEPRKGDSYVRHVFKKNMKFLKKEFKDIKI